MFVNSPILVILLECSKQQLGWIKAQRLTLEIDGTTDTGMQMFAFSKDKFKTRNGQLVLDPDVLEAVRISNYPEKS